MMAQLDLLEKVGTGIMVVILIYSLIQFVAFLFLYLGMPGSDDKED